MIATEHITPYDAVLLAIERLIDMVPSADSPEGQLLVRLAEATEAYERENGWASPHKNIDHD